ncbi:SixA phosphatase family protein [Indioceanicola profundi]|uniref:SixA phosphatase family protein n=1 Tax=Indioceanicola profundi TaxID=2220096 RepID=UPI000E6AC5AE|nr:histidine phosphatase family protein [Indioceanicola profundi]
MKTLYLLRHAKSAWDDPDLDDHDRPLAPRGQRAAATMAKYLGERKAGPPMLDLVLCSTAVRARQTLERVLPAWTSPPRVLVERDLYLCGADALLERLRGLPEEVGAAMVVAHNPDLHKLATGLAADGPEELMHSLHAKLPTAGFVTLSINSGEGWGGLDWGQAMLADYVTPRSLD